MDDIPSEAFADICPHVDDLTCLLRTDAGRAKLNAHFDAHEQRLLFANLRKISAQEKRAQKMLLEALKGLRDNRREFIHLMQNVKDKVSPGESDE